MDPEVLEALKGINAGFEAQKKALADVHAATAALRTDLDAMKKPSGRTDHDVIDRERSERINGDVGNSQAKLDELRRRRAASRRTTDEVIEGAQSTLDRVRAAQAGARPATAGSLRTRGGEVINARVRPQSLPRNWFARGLNHLTGEQLSSEQLKARNEYADRFFAWCRNPKSSTSRLEECAAHAAMHSPDGGQIMIRPQAAMQTQIGEQGGFLVPSEMENAVIQLGGVYSAMRLLADVRTITQGQVLKQPVNVQGATFAWTGETATRPLTAGDNINMLEWPLMECYAQPDTTNILLQDAAFDVESWLMDAVTREFAEGEGLAFISGSGSLQPRGIQSYTMVADASWIWGQIGFVVSGVSNAITDSSHNGYDALLDMIRALHRRYLPGATFLMNRTSENTIRKVKDGNDNYMWQPSVSVDKPATLFGYPVETDDNVPDANTNTFPIMFGDYQQAYRIVDKGGMAMLVNPYTSPGKTIYYTTKRVGGGIKNFEAVKFLKCST